MDFTTVISTVHAISSSQQYHQNTHWDKITVDHKYFEYTIWYVIFQINIRQSQNEDLYLQVTFVLSHEKSCKGLVLFGNT